MNHCPGSSVRGNNPILVAHEFGHNLGFHHSGIEDKGEYNDRSSMMGASTGGHSMTINMAHRCAARERARRRAPVGLCCAATRALAS